MPSLEERLCRIESALAILVGRSTTMQFYSTGEFAELIGRSELTVREYCRMGRIKASKRASGRGAHRSWAISHEEFVRFQRDGLLPFGKGLE